MPGSRVTTDPCAYQEAVRSAQVEVLVTAQGDFHSELTRIDLHNLSMQSGRETLPRVGRSPGEIVINAAGSTYHHVTSSLCHWGTCRLPRMSSPLPDARLPGAISHHPTYHKS
jgi:hypothetical protein